jgi:hypothetical protein
MLPDLLANGRINRRKIMMTKAEIKKAQKNLEKWRKSHEDIDALKKTYRESIPEQVRASMAFEGEHVSIKMLKKHLKTLKRNLRK